MEAIHSPSDIEVLLHFHVSNEPHPRRDAPAVQKAIQQFLEAGAIEPCPGSQFRTTKMGQAWVKALCCVPPPKLAYVDEIGKVFLYV